MATNWVRWIGQLGIVPTASFTIALLLAGCGGAAFAAQSSSGQHALLVKVNPANGNYSVGVLGANFYALTAEVGAQVDGRWLYASDYPRHKMERSTGPGYLGTAVDWRVTYSGLSGQPDLIYYLRAYSGIPFGDIQVTVRNTTAKTIYVEAIRSLQTIEGQVLDLGGPTAQDRVLSDSFSENEPSMRIHDLADAADHLHRAVGSQLIYNRQSRESLLLGALTSNSFLTILRLHLAGSSGNAPRLAAYEVDSTGTTEMQKENSLKHSSPGDQVQLNLPVMPGAELSSERLLFSLSKDYHRQLETYGSLIREIHHARTSAPSLMGWWSWTAYYLGLNEGTALTNAEWEAERLKSFGYNVFHIDEGYQYARGEYTTPNATVFPHGLIPVYYKVRGLGLIPGIWTAPFEVSERSWVYLHHKDWLVKNAEAIPIQIGSMGDSHNPAMRDRLFVLDTTNPGAQEYLRKTYSILVNRWGVRYIKLDFMDDSAIEGYYYKPSTTAMEAQRIGLKIIRDTVGNGVYLDKDGSPMLNPVGFVDYGRISVDTGHTFGASKEAAPGIAARFYMDRNFYVDDPDAFGVSTQTFNDQTWHAGKKPVTLDEAKVSIALPAIAGGMFEIGDNLPSLWKSHKRLALIENRELIDMVRLGRASVPIDLMSYAPEDQQPSIFFLKEDSRQSILAIFNWTEKERNHTVDLSTLGLPATGQYTVTNVFAKREIPVHPPDVLTLHQPPHSVRMLKIIDTRIPAVAPVVTTKHPSSGNTGETMNFSAQNSGSDPVLSYTWNFGDGVTLEGKEVRHAYTEPGTYTVRLKATGLSSLDAQQSFEMHVSGHISTIFDPGKIKRYR